MLLKFINREEELNALEKAYHSKKAEFFVVYGRRRVGKTELLKRFAQNKPHFYFLSRKQPLILEIGQFQNKFAEKFNLHLQQSQNWEDLFKSILGKISPKEKMIFIVDEFPYWIEQNKEITSEWQYLWDEILQKQNIFLILCGSYVSIMEEQVLGKSSPLYGRRTGQIELNALKTKHIKAFLPKYDTEQIIKIYGAVGTIPFYLKEMEDSLSFSKNIKNTFFNKSNILNQEANFLLREELREVNVYFNLLKTIIDGATTLSEISSKAKVDITNVNKYLNTLIGLKLIKKIKPIIAPEKNNKYLYQLQDNYFRFWLNYVYPYQSEIEENAESVIKVLEKNYPSYMGYIFEEVCRKIIKELDINVDKVGLLVGSWWHKDKEIDLVAKNDTTKEVIFGECKWKENIDAYQLLSELKEKSKSISWNNSNRKECFVLFAKSFKDKIKEDNVYLFDLKSLGKHIRN